MKAVLLPILAAAVPMTAARSSACTSFVDYSSGSAWYGMNFDWYPETDILFRIRNDAEGRRSFTMSFVTFGGPVPTAGMTADGRFSALQVTDAPWTGPPQDSGNAFIFWPFHALILRGADMADIRDLVANDTFIQYDDPPLHVITADASGDAMIIEVGESGNEVLERTNEPFMVMTNFMCCAWRGASPAVIEGFGADRYRRAFESLVAIEGAMSVERGMAVLEAARSTSGDCPTRASMLFDGARGVVYISPAGRFDIVWSVDIATERMTLESGDCGRMTMVMDSSGVALAELLI